MWYNSLVAGCHEQAIVAAQHPLHPTAQGGESRLPEGGWQLSVSRREWEWAAGELVR